jgi:AcrR family transcriptional regulator
MARTARQTREERREHALSAAREEFARAGMQGSVDLIADRAGVTSSYLLRLFGTKKTLFLAVVERAFEHTLSEYQQATNGKRGNDALQAIQAMHRWLSRHDRVTGMIQLQAFAACDDDDVRAVVATGYGRLVEFVVSVSDATPAELARFMAYGTQRRALAALQMTSGREVPKWAQLLNTGATADLSR